MYLSVCLPACLYVSLSVCLAVCSANSVLICLFCHMSLFDKSSPMRLNASPQMEPNSPVTFHMVNPINGPPTVLKPSVLSDNPLPAPFIDTTARHWQP